MSTGNLCGASLLISDHINGENTKLVLCDLYEGHEGDHSKMFYHCAEIPNDKIFKSNHRLGRISWKPELSIK